MRFLIPRLGTAEKFHQERINYTRVAKYKNNHVFGQPRLFPLVFGEFVFMRVQKSANGEPARRKSSKTSAHNANWRRYILDRHSRRYVLYFANVGPAKLRHRPEINTDIIIFYYIARTKAGAYDRAPSFSATGSPRPGEKPPETVRTAARRAQRRNSIDLNTHPACTKRESPLYW